ncbi:nucleotide sugar dehydratase [Campylobacterota bacterium]|nr:nucleotide sugar dehydratase [Campylobacterota bacterium]
MIENRIVQEDIAAIIGCGLDFAALRGKVFLVTGASGMIGKMIVKVLEHIGADVITVHGKDAAKNIFGAIEYIDYIIHAASPSTPKQVSVDYLSTIDANVAATRNLLELAKKYSAKLLLISSGSVYGNPIVSEEVDESSYGYIDIGNINSVYAESKRLAEVLALCFAVQFNTEVYIARLSSVFGPGIDLQSGGVHADFLKNALDGKDITIKSDGLAKRSFIYLSDAVSGIFYILLKGERSRAYNVANPREYKSIRSLAFAVQSAAEKLLSKTLNVTYADTNTNNTLSGSHYQKGAI